MRENQLVQRLSAASVDEGRLLPYLTAGFPDAAVCERVIRALDELGVAAVEIGFPFSDSIADGPVIQSSFHEALARGFKTADAFRMIERLRPAVRCGLIAMVSYSLAHRMGLSAFIAGARSVGFDGLILPDVPTEESAPIVLEAERAELCVIGMVAPTTSVERQRRIALSSSGFLYYVSTTGTTGERATFPENLAEVVRALKRMSGLPVMVGFGISTSEQVRRLCAFADGVIVGSSLVRRLAERTAAGDPPAAAVEAVRSFAAELLAATKHTS
jgi:tryptophan synthase alpha chain